MVNNDIIPAVISNFIPGQVPQFYVADQSLLPTFIQCYYQWLESNNALHYTRNFLNLTDVDQTTDQFLVWIKEKYLKNIQLNTQSDTRQLIKHALDIYRSKGSEQSIDLLFRLIFNQACSIYYPKTDLFKLSDGDWFTPQYIELSLSQNNSLLNQKKIIGLTSKATAFVDSYVRIGYNTRLSDILYISAIEGVFETGEIIVPIDNSLAISQCPYMVGSLNEINIGALGTGSNFNIGDIVNITSPSGNGAIARVANITSQSGILNVDFNNGGYGYSSSANLIVSNSTLIFNITSTTNSYAQQYVYPFETINQPYCLINYVNANNTLTPGSNIYTYFANNVVDGIGSILSVMASNTSAGMLEASILSGNLNYSYFYTSGNTIFANTNVSNGVTIVYANAEVIGTSNVVLICSNLTSSFIDDEQIVQYNYPMDNTYQYAIGYNSLSFGNNIVISNNQGIFLPGKPVYGLTSNASATVGNIQLSLGIINPSNNFLVTPNNYCTLSNFKGTLTTVGSISKSSFAMSNVMNFTETVLINTDKLSTFSPIQLKAATYGFVANSIANSASAINSCMTYTNTVIGQLSNIYAVSGIQLDYPPVVVVYDPKTYSNRFDKSIFITGSTSNFIIGEEIVQFSSNARGVIKEGNSSILFIEDLRFNDNNQFVLTSNSTTYLTGVLSGSTANIVQIENDLNSSHMGFNVNLSVTSSSANGVISELQLLGSGFNFVDGEEVIITANNNLTASPGLGIALLDTSGIGQSFYRQKGGFLSDQKKLFDGYYWQNYSYEILSPQMFDKYQDTFKNLVHVAGTLMFGRFVHVQKIDMGITNQTTTIHLC